MIKLIVIFKALKSFGISFTDQPFINTKDKTKNAVILITNPLDARFVYGKEIETTLKAMKDSTHIRILGKFIYI